MRRLLTFLFLGGLFLGLRSYAQEIEQTPTETPVPAESESTDEPEKKWEWENDWRRWDGFHFKRIRYFPEGEQVKDKHGVVRVDYSQVGDVGKVGGKFQFDGASFLVDDSPTGKGNVGEVRKARVYVVGDVVALVPFSYFFEAGISGGRFHTEKFYLILKERPLAGTVWIGQFRAPMGFEATASGEDNVFMETSSASSAFAPGTSIGIGMVKALRNQRTVFSLGLYSKGVGENNFDASKDYFRLVTRFTGLAVDRTSADTPEWLHLGICANRLRSASSKIRYRSRPESHLASFLVDTGEMDAQDATTQSLEAAWVKGPCTIQGEYFLSRVKATSGISHTFTGWYVQGSWFPTGESRPYTRGRGLPGRVQPLRPVSRKGGGWGALELGLRYSFVDLSSGGVMGGTMRSVTAGLNWYLNANAKIRINYLVSRIDRYGLQPKSRILQARFGLRF